MEKPPVIKPTEIIKNPDEQIESGFQLENGEKPGFEMQLEITLKTPQQYETQLIESGKHVSEHVKETLYKMPSLEQPITLDIVSYTVEQLGFTYHNHTIYPTYEDIKSRAVELGLKPCPPQVGPELCMQFTNKQPNMGYLIVMDAILDGSGEPMVWCANNNSDGLGCIDGSERGSRFDFDRHLVFSK